MSVHEILSNSKDFHILQSEHNNIKYVYVTNINKHDNMLAIIKYTMPLQVEQYFQNHLELFNKGYHANLIDTIYIVVGYEHERYYLHLTLAHSKNLNWSHWEVLRINAPSMDILIEEYLKAIKTKGVQNMVLRGLRGDAFTPCVNLNF